MGRRYACVLLKRVSVPRLFHLLILFLLAGCVPHAGVQKDWGSHDKEQISLILEAAEGFFVALKDSDFDASWTLLSTASRESIVHDVYETSLKFGATIRRENILSDFERRGVLFRNYWKSFHRNFDTDIVLEQSLWKMGTVAETRAEIIIQYNKNSSPTVLKMFKEDNEWKVGLNETFSRGAIEKWLEYLQIMHGV